MGLFDNPCFWAAFWSWFAAQAIKMLLAFRAHRFVDFRYLASTGGMPSAHSALAAGLATAVGISAGWDSPVAATTVALAIIVMFDASTVRRAAGNQARILNQIVEELFKHHHLSEQKLGELLGHTRLEVVMGMLLGIVIALLVLSRF